MFTLDSPRPNASDQPAASLGAAPAQDVEMTDEIADTDYFQVMMDEDQLHSTEDHLELCSTKWHLVQEDMKKYPHFGHQQPMVLLSMIGIKKNGRPAHIQQFDFECTGYTEQTHRYRVTKFYAKGGEGESYECVRFPDDTVCSSDRFCLKIIPADSAMNRPINFDVEHEFLQHQLKPSSHNTAHHYCAHLGPFQNAAQFGNRRNRFETDLGYLLMQSLPNKDFFDHIDWSPARNIYAESDAKFFAKGLIHALSHLHNTVQNVHCDLAFDNIMLDRFGNLVLIDFGLSLANLESPRPAGWSVRAIRHQTGGGATGKPRDFFSWAPEWLDALWNSGGNVELHQGAWSLDQSNMQYASVQSTIDLMKTDVWIAGSIILYLLIGDHANSLIVDSLVKPDQTRPGRHRGDPETFQQRIDASYDLDQFRRWFSGALNPDGSPTQPVQLSDQGLDFLRCIFTDEHRRWSAEQLLEHPWLLGVPDDMPSSLREHVYGANPDMAKDDTIKVHAVAAPLPPAFGAPVAPAFGASVAVADDGEDVKYRSLTSVSSSTGKQCFKGESISLPAPFAPTNARNTNFLPAGMSGPHEAAGGEGILARVRQCLAAQLDRLQEENCALKSAMA
jgi:serine/threonine protein kinase